MNITKELEIYLCPIAEDCLFYTKPFFISKAETHFYNDYCLSGGKSGEQTCGMKHHYDVSERLKRMQKKNGRRKNEKNNNRISN